jgi:hypothetical protein
LRSAAPPKRFQTFFAIVCSAREADSRVASVSLGVNCGSSASHPDGSSPASIDFNSAASPACALA